MRPLPEWVHEGVIIGVEGGTDVALQKLEGLTAADVPVCAFWIQDWVGQTADSAEGLWKEVWAPLGKPAVFYKQGSEVGAQFLAALKAEGID